MKPVSVDDLKTLYIPPSGSHKGQNGRLLLIGGSHLFHAASLWALNTASRIVDLVHYASVPENNEIVTRAKEEFRNGIVVTRADVDAYIAEDDCILIGVGMTRDNETEMLTGSLLKKYPQKQWVIDAGSLQMLNLSNIPKHAILTPHHGEFAILWDKAVGAHPEFASSMTDEEKVRKFAATYDCVVLLKGEKDLVCDGADCHEIVGGNVGLTKGGTGDVLSGLVAALACKNDPLLAATAGSFINKNAGDALFQTVGPYFNATDLTGEIPKTMNRLFIDRVTSQAVQ